MAQLGSSAMAHPYVGPVAVRPHTIRRDGQDRDGRQRRERVVSRWSRYVLVFDTETRTDATQALLFGSYAVCEWIDNALVTRDEGLFYAEELPEEDPEGFATLARYAQTYGCRMRTREEFVRQIFFPALCELGAIVAGFNLPFDLSRIAIECGEARGRFYGGFSLALLDYVDQYGRRKPDEYYARVCVKALDSKRALVGLAGGREERKGKRTRGRFLDLRTLAFALTNRSHSLASACTAFGVVQGKSHAAEHGVITASYIDYNRQDVRATVALLTRLRAEFDAHPVELDPCGTYSPASIAKAYLRALGVQPPAEQFGAVPSRVLGDAMCGYYGGRSEVRIRNRTVPCVYTDFLSMYPTVNARLGLWSLLTAERIEIVDATAEVRQLLETVTLDGCFDPSLWRTLTFFAQIQPNADVLPVRARYAEDVRGWNIGVNIVKSDNAWWYAGPDAVASALLTGNVPHVVKAFRLVPRGQQGTLCPIKIAGVIDLDPRSDDFFRALPEERARIAGDGSLSPAEKARLREFVKVLANSGSYGIFAQVNSLDLPKGKRASLDVHGNSTRFACESRFAESGGPFCFPPIAALITAAARLMLAMLERCVSDLGGHYVLCDTDSMAIVATEHGGTILCDGGPLRTVRGAAIQALSWADVRGIVARFAALSPYDSTVISGSVLKIEAENFDPCSGEQRQLHVLAISAKRYALFQMPDGRVDVLKASEHGLGHLLNPRDPDTAGADWITETWRWLIARELGHRARMPRWAGRPAISRITVSSPSILRPLADVRRSYRGRVKPFNFALSAHVAPFGHPPDADPERFHLFAPYERDASVWLSLSWTDAYSGRQFAVTTAGPSSVGAVAVKSYADVIQSYAVHPEAKSAAPDGTVCDRSTRGLLRRRTVRATGLEYIGKESRRLDEVETGRVHSLAELVATFTDEMGAWRECLLPFLRSLPRKAAAELLGLSERTVAALRNERANPSAQTRMRLHELWIQRCAVG